MAVTNARVSVIVPTCNRATLLERAIRSVLDQSERRLELIVVDDASRDDTGARVLGFADPRLTYLRNEQNEGAAAARNRGVAATRAPVLAFLDDDDYWLPERLARHLPVFESLQADAGISVCSHEQLYDSHTVQVGGPRHFANLRFDRGPFGDFSLIATPGWLMRREVFEASGGFDPRMRCWDDWELALRVAARWRLHHFDESLWVQDRRRIAPGMFNNRGKFANDVGVLVEKHGAGWPAEVVTRQWLLAGYAEAATAGTAAAVPALRRAVDSSPWSLRARASLILALAGDRAWGLARGLLRKLPATGFKADG